MGAVGHFSVSAAMAIAGVRPLPAAVRTVLALPIKIRWQLQAPATAPMPVQSVASGPAYFSLSFQTAVSEDRE